jgi:predicted DNA-binding protein with PD1-like motif
MVSTGNDTYGSAHLKRVILTRIEPNHDLLAELEHLATNEGIKVGIILSGVGSLKECVLRNLRHFPKQFPIDDKSRLYKTITGPLEILSLTGNIIETEDGQLVVHAHISLSAVKGNEVITLGGHLVKGCLTYVMVEVVIGELWKTKTKRKLNSERKALELSFS